LSPSFYIINTRPDAIQDDLVKRGINAAKYNLSSFAKVRPSSHFGSHVADISVAGPYLADISVAGIDLSDISVTGYYVAQISVKRALSC